MYLKTHIIEELIEDKNGTGCKPSSRRIKHGLCRGVYITVDVHEGNWLIMLYEKSRQRVMEQAVDDRYISGNLWYLAFAVEIQPRVAIPRPLLRKTQETVETKELSGWSQPSKVADSDPSEDTKLEGETHWDMFPSPFEVVEFVAAEERGRHSGLDKGRSRYRRAVLQFIAQGVRCVLPRECVGMSSYTPHEGPDKLVKPIL